MTYTLDFIPFEILDLQSNQPGPGNEKKHFFEEQIMRILQEADAVGTVREVCRQINITELTFYRSSYKYGGMEVQNTKQLRTLEQENFEMKKLVAEFSLD